MTENRGYLEIDALQGTWTPAQLREWRKSRGLIQRDAAALLGVAKRTYHYVERGKTRGGYTLTTIPRQVELAVKGLDCEFGVHEKTPAELNAAYAKAVVALEEAAGMVPTYRATAPEPREPRVLPAKASQKK